MNCEQKTTDHENMYWYYHSRGQGLKLIVSMLRGNNPDYEKNYTGYEMTRTNGDKRSTLKIKSPEAKHQGVYFCASSDGQYNYQAYFGEGTVLSVLEDNGMKKGPSITIYKPNKKELEINNFISLVCVASNFFPEHVKIRWFVNNKERVNLYDPVPQKKDNSSYSTSKRLTLTKSEYFNPDSKFRCEAAFLDGSDKVSAEVEGETDCGVSKESYAMYINQGKFSYILVLCKSGLYALIVLLLLWRKKILRSY